MNLYMSLFDKVIDRKNTSSSKWGKYKGYKNISVFTISDMDFKTPQPILDDIGSVLKLGILGYSNLDDRYINACINWLKRKHNWDVQSKWIVPCTTVKGALNAVIEELTQPYDTIYSFTPGYLGNIPLIKNRKLVKIPLNDNDISYSLSQINVTNNAKIFFLCNPHNPTGRIWTFQELKIIADFCLQHKLILISDDIHQDLVISDSIRYVSIYTVEPNIQKQTIVFLSPSKTFNLSGMQASYLVVKNKLLREKIINTLKKYTLYYPNIIAIEAFCSAYTKCDHWLDDLLVYLKKNYNFLKSSLKPCYPFLKLANTEASYLAWIDFRKMNMKNDKIAEILLRDYQIVLENGNNFGILGEGFFRINFACPYSRIKYLTLSLVDFIENNKP